MPNAATRAAKTTIASTQTTSGANTSVVSGRLVKGASLPSVSGRGRKAGAVPQVTMDALMASLAGEGVYEFSGAPNKITNHKNMIKNKVVIPHNEVKGNKKIRAEFVTTEGKMPSGGNSGTDSVTVVCALVYLDSDESK